MSIRKLAFGLLLLAGTMGAQASSLVFTYTTTDGMNGTVVVRPDLVTDSFFDDEEFGDPIRFFLSGPPAAPFIEFDNLLVQDLDSEAFSELVVGTNDEVDFLFLGTSYTTIIAASETIEPASSSAIFVGPGQELFGGLRFEFAPGTLGNIEDFSLSSLLDLDLNSSTFAQLILDNGFGTDFFDLASASVSAVPLPAAAWFLLSGLAGLFGFKRFSVQRSPA